MPKPKYGIIIGAILGTLVVAAGVIIPLYFFVWNPNPTYPTWDLEFYGDTVDQSTNITYQEIQEDFTPTPYTFNHTKWWTPDGYLSEIQNYTGIPLWDLIEYSGVDFGRANALRFVANDGWASPELSLEDVENNKSLIIVYYVDEGETLTGPEDGGNGYLMSAVNYSINEAKKSSHFNLKWLVGIEFLVDWDVTLFGESPLVEENMTISYNDILTHGDLTRVNTIINYTKPGIYSELRNVTGVTLWSVIQHLEVNYTTATHINFVASDGFATYNMSLGIVENNASKVLIVYMEDGELLDPLSDGYLISIVDYSITEGYAEPKSSRYSAKFLNGIEFIDAII
jgi:hypothetical protein